MKHAAIRLGGAINVVMAIFHAFFPLIFQWRETLAGLSPINRAITYTLSNHLTLLIAAFAYASFAYTKELSETPVGRGISKFIVAFYALRIIEEWTEFKSPWPQALGLAILCGIIAAAYWIGSTPSHSKVTASPALGRT